MIVLTNLRKLGEAVLAALAVLFGFRTDPALRAVLVPVDDPWEPRGR